MEEKFYYKDSNNNLLDSKHELLEEELDDYIKITEEEYFAIKSEIKQRSETAKQEPINQKKARIGELKRLLSSSDWQQHKWLDGELTDEAYAPIKTQRHAWRVEINQLEEELENEQ